ncbi:uncharacterized protein JCM6883_006360 [Sporobolomyces salmoneus]|uniref:uncharacterized protein n=1 Tax=Sporobolomyces salmoneus TaxID=183962 RepID=UPI0031829949
MAERSPESSPAPFVPLPETISFLYSLPLPPGVSSQPQPQSQQDWALVEQYRLLCQSLNVLAEYERARRAEGLEPVEWQDLKLPNSPSSPPPPAPSSNPPRSTPPTRSIHEELSSHNAVAQLSQSLSTFPSSSFTFTSSGSLADGSLSLDLSLPLDLDSNSGPASLPSLMSAISELEHCVARLSLEANEARNLQRSLRTEMATRQHSNGAISHGNGNGNGNGTGGKGSVNSAKKNGKKSVKNSNSNGTQENAANYDHDQYQLDLEYQHDQLEKRANEVVVAATNALSNGAGEGNAIGSGSGLGVKSWEDRELMKALESVSMLDKRADEYRERLKILKEQIHHHAALADALASQSSSPRSKGGKNGNARFGDVASDTGMRLINAPRSKK